MARAALAGKTDGLEFLIRQGAAIDAPDLRGITPLMLAARAGSLGAVTALLAAHANPNAADQSGNTVLMHAAVGGQIAVIDRLLGSGAAVAARNVQDWSALDFAEVNGLPEVAARLKESGATGLRRSAITSGGDLTFVQRPGGAHKDLYAGWPDIAVAAVKTVAFSARFGAGAPCGSERG